MSPVAAVRIARVSRVVADLDRAEAFYREVLKFETIGRGVSNTAKLGWGDAEEVVLRLGTTEVALVRFAVRGDPYPDDSRSNDLWFQHLAVVVGDMDAAYRHVTLAGRSHPISEGGPQQLPPANGSVRAFKFRDPDGHPLELLWFPGGDHSMPLFQRIDHSALAVSATDASLTFYRSLGFVAGDRSVNKGPAQNRLDGLPNAHVLVIGLRPAPGARPGLELLGYDPPGRPAGPWSPHDLVTDWVTVELDRPDETMRSVRDPDGHCFLLVPQGSGLPARAPIT